MTSAFFRWIKHFFRPPQAAKIDVSRRGIIVGGVAGIGTALFVRSSALGENRTFSPELVRRHPLLPKRSFYPSASAVVSA